MKITKKQLKELKKQYELNTIEQEVLNEALRQDDPEIWFKDLLQHGCVSGMIPKLIYYYQTAKFFDKHYDQIDELRDNYQDETGEALKIEGDLKNCLSWFAYEEVARSLYENDLEQEW